MKTESNKEVKNILVKNYNSFNKNKQTIKGFTSNNSLNKYKNKINIHYKKNPFIKDSLFYNDENNKINKKSETEKYSYDIYNTDINYLLNNKEYEQLNFFPEKKLSYKNYWTENKNNNKHYKFPNGYIDKKLFENILNKYELNNKKI